MTDDQFTTGRRGALKALGLTAGYFALPALARPVAAQQIQSDPNSPFHFPQGVASGDPQPDGVVIWTRGEDKNALGQGMTLRAQMSRTPDFATLLVNEKLTVGPDSDNCLRLFVHGLEPDTEYFYRFMAGPVVSRTGRTRTAPAPEADKDVRFAFASCQSYEQAFYGAWARMLADDAKRPPAEQIQFVLFLGDFIYEVRGDRWDQDMRSPKWLKDAAGKLREIPPFPNGSAPWPSTNWNINPGATNAVTLADYRHLYKLYLSDPHLQNARARWPFVSTWDDHEFTNDAWQSHDTYLDGPGKPAQTRKVVANKAWFEYIPAALTDAAAPKGVTNPAFDFRGVSVSDSPFQNAGFGPDEAIDPNPDNLTALNSMRIYRSLRWGKRLEVFLTDNRTFKSPPPETPKDKDGKRPPLPPADWVKILDAGRTANGGKPPATMPGSDTPNPRAALPPGSVLGKEQKDWFKAALKASDATWKVWANSFPALPIRLDLDNVPFAGMAKSCLGVDGWNGYPGERKELLEFLRDNRITNVVACAGDHHAHFAGRLIPDLDDPAGKAVALEFATAGISSEPLFPGVQRAAASNAVFAAMASFERGGTTVENWHRTLLGGAYSALMTAFTGSEAIGDMYWKPGASPGLDFVDTNSNGYVVMTFEAAAGSAAVVATTQAETDTGESGAPVLRVSTLKFKAWKPGEEPALSKPEIAGAPLYPFA
jgi:alkaline phosphatase D